MESRARVALIAAAAVDLVDQSQVLGDEADSGTDAVAIGVRPRSWICSQWWRQPFS